MSYNRLRSGRRGPRRRAGAAVLLLGSLSLAACGTTVPLQSQSSADGANGVADGTAAPGQTGAGALSAGSGGSGSLLPGHSGTSGSGTTGQVSVPGRSSGGGPTAGASDAPLLPGNPDTSPLTIGVLAAGDTQQGAKTAGADSGTSTSAAAALKALIRNFQATRLAGRPLKVVYKEVPVTTTNYETELAADCALFTQDNHVDLVLSDIGYYNKSLTACLDHAHVPQIEGGWGLTSDADFRSYADYYTPGFPSYDFRFASVVTAGVSSGALKRGSHVGIVIEDCPQISGPAQSQLIPRARAAGLTVVTSSVTCTQGFQSAGQISEQMQQAAFNFRAKGVETVMFATYPTGVDLVFFTQYASSQGYHPDYWLDSLAEVPVASAAGQYPKDQYVNMKGAGWSTPMDQSQFSLARPEQKRCVQILRRQGVSVTRPADYLLAESACDPFFLLQDALKKTGGHTDHLSLRQGIEALGSSFQSGVLTGTTQLRAGRHYGTAQLALFGYFASCDCFRYTSTPRAW